MKRAGEETTPDDEFNKKTKVDEEGAVVREKKEFEARFLIEKRIMGLIIGKGGSRIKAMRDECGVYASILKLKQPQESAPERVMVLQGSTEQISHAMRNVAQLMVESAQEREQKTSAEPGSLSSSVKITVLCDMSQAGAIIGKAGATIKQTQAETGAKMQVSKEALPGSTERSCQISGAVDVVQAATLMVLNQLKEYPSQTSKSILYVPNTGIPAPSPYGAAAAADPYGGFGAIGQPAPAHAQAYGHFQQSPFGLPSPYGQDQYAAATPAQSGPQSKQQIAIPTMCAGGVIGKGGHRIREIQAQSETIIQIAPADAATPHERIVSISGPSTGVQTAVALIRQTVEQEYQPAGGPAAY